LDEYLMDNASWALPPNKCGFCLVHKRPCPVNPGLVIASRRLGLSPEQISSDMAPPTSAPVPHEAWWASELPSAIEDGTDSDSAKQEPLSINISGLICTDLSPLGQQKGDAGSSMREHSVWGASRSVLAKRKHEHAFFIECSDRYDASRRQLHLEPTHTILSIKTSPLLQGFPKRRRRCLVGGLNKSLMVWCGVAPDEVQADFERVHNRLCNLTADIYFDASKADVLENHARIAKGRDKVFLKESCEGEALGEQIHKVCSLSNMQIKHECEDFFEKRNIVGPRFACLEQHPGRGSTPGNFLPALDTHAKIYSWARDRLATPRELFGAMGIDMRLGPLSGGRSLSPLASIIPELPPRAQLLIAGNGMHVPVMTSWFVYVLTRSVRIEAFFTMPRSLAAAAAGQFHDDDDIFEGVP
jgi:hypothetical protein